MRSQPPGDFASFPVNYCNKISVTGIEQQVIGREAFIAKLDALLQDESRRAALLSVVVEPLADVQKKAREQASRKAAATKVDFFTLVRGDE